MSLMWTFLTKNNLWTEWTKLNYCTVKQLWTMKIDNNASCAWKHMLRLRSNGKQFFNIIITKGENTSLLEEP